MKHYYASQSPRGFANEINVYSFSSRAARDAWVEDHAHDGDMNSASLGAYAITASEARSICGYKGDACTESLNSSEPIPMD